MSLQKDLLGPSVAEAMNVDSAPIVLVPIERKSCFLL